MNNREISLLLPTTGEPLILHFWLQNLKKYKHLVNNVFVAVDCMGKLNPMEFIFVENYLRRQLSRIPDLREHFNYCLGEHGRNIDSLFKNYEPDIKENVLLMEEDNFIINPQLLEKEINSYFDDNYDVIGCPRGSCTPYLGEIIREYVWTRPDLHLDTKLRRDEITYNFWPTLLLTKKQHFLNSSRNFGSKTWESGSLLKLGESETVLREQCNGDTMVPFSIELYQKPEIKKVKLLDNVYHSRLEDNEFIPQIVDTSIDFHVGSLSGMLVNRLWKPFTGTWDTDSYVPYIRKIKNEPYARIEIMETYRRLLLLQQMLYTLKDPKEFEFFNNYEANLERIINIYETENDMPAILDSFCIAALKGGIDVDKYAMVCKKML